MMKLVLLPSGYVFSVNDVPHDSKVTEFGRRFLISHYKYRGSFSVMSGKEMCRDRHDQERNNLFLFSHYVHYAMIKTEKRFFFHLGTTFTTQWSRQKKVFFRLNTTLTTLWSREKKDFFIMLLCSLHHHQDRKKFFFHLVTTFTTTWSRQKKFFFV